MMGVKRPARKTAHNSRPLLRLPTEVFSTEIMVFYHYRAVYLPEVASINLQAEIISPESGLCYPGGRFCQKAQNLLLGGKRSMILA